MTSTGDPAELRPAAFIDRDGTLIEEVNFLSRVEDLRVFPFTAKALSVLKENGFRVIVLTNQSGIGRGLYSEKEMYAIHGAMQEQLNGAIDAFYFCPHLPNEACRCRKPGLGMIDQARSEFQIDMQGSWMIGDKRIDVETGLNAGIRAAMVMTGYGRGHLKSLAEPPDVSAENILEAVEAIIRMPRSEAAP